MDFVKDNNPKYLKHAESMLGSFPEYVKSAYDRNKVETVDSLSSSAFANPSSREFPLDTKENTFLSYAYYKAAGVDDAKVAGKIKTAATRYGVDLEELDSKYAVPAVSDDTLVEKFAVAIDTNSNAGVKFYYPTHNRLAIEKSARDLAEDFDRIPLTVFRHAALNIVKAAKQNDIDASSLPDRIRFTGAHREFNHKFASQAVRQREQKLGVGAADVYKEIVKSASVDVEHVNDYVNLFLEMDELHGVKYAANMLNPYEAFFSGHDIDELEKTANAYVVIYEAPIPLEEFTKLASETINKNFAFEEKEMLLDVVKTASDTGGIAASGKIVQFPKELQKRFLHSLAGNSLPKFANFDLMGGGINGTQEVGAPPQSAASSAEGSSPALGAGGGLAGLNLPSPQGGPVGTGPGLSLTPNINLGSLTQPTPLGATNPPIPEESLNEGGSEGGV
jgi:hypothetical protein